MSQINPYESPERPQDSPLPAQAASQLRRCRLAVVVVTVVVALAAIGNAISAAGALARLARRPQPEFADNPLMRSIAEAEAPLYRYELRRAIACTLTTALLAAFAYCLGAYSRALRRATLGIIGLPELLPPQANCWLVGAFLAVAAMARIFVKF